MMKQRRRQSILVSSLMLMLALSCLIRQSSSRRHVSSPSNMRVLFDEDGMPFKRELKAKSDKTASIKSTKSESATKKSKADKSLEKKAKAPSKDSKKKIAEPSTHAKPDAGDNSRPGTEAGGGSDENGVLPTTATTTTTTTTSTTTTTARATTARTTARTTRKPSPSTVAGVAVVVQPTEPLETDIPIPPSKGDPTYFVSDEEPIVETTSISTSSSSDDVICTNHTIYQVIEHVCTCDCGCSSDNSTDGDGGDGGNSTDGDGGDGGNSTDGDGGNGEEEEEELDVLVQFDIDTNEVRYPAGNVPGGTVLLNTVGEGVFISGLSSNITTADVKIVGACTIIDSEESLTSPNSNAVSICTFSVVIEDDPTQLFSRTILSGTINHERFQGSLPVTGTGGNLPATSGELLVISLQASKARAVLTLN